MLNAKIQACGWIYAHQLTLRSKILILPLSLKIWMWTDHVLRLERLKVSKHLSSPTHHYPPPTHTHNYYQPSNFSSTDSAPLIFTTSKPHALWPYSTYSTPQQFIFAKSLFLLSLFAFYHGGFLASCQLLPLPQN